jgi:hypothetical protein
MPELKSVNDRIYSRDEILVLLDGKLSFTFVCVCPISRGLFDPISVGTITCSIVLSPILKLVILVFTGVFQARWLVLYPIIL